MSLALRLWRDHSKILVESPKRCNDALVLSFYKSACFMEFKCFFLDRLLFFMSYNQVDSILDSIE